MSRNDQPDRSTRKGHHHGHHVEIDALSDRARQNYLYARAVIGREYAYPTVRRAWRNTAH